MKKYMIILLCFFLWNCSEDELPLYNGKTCVYFSYTNPMYPDRYLGEMSFSFGLLTTMDTVIYIPVTGMGDTVGYDRHFSFVIDSMTGQEGIQLDPLPKEGIFPAGSSVGYIPISLHRILDDDSVYYIHLRLVSNDEFEVNVPESYYNKDTTDLTRIQFTYSSAITIPKAWVEFYFGYFSVAKYRVCSELLGVEPGFWTKYPSNPMVLVSYGNIFKIYVESKIKEGVNQALADPQNKQEKGYMTMRKAGGITIPADWPDADKR